MKKADANIPIEITETSSSGSTNWKWVNTRRSSRGRSTSSSMTTNRAMQSAATVNRIMIG